MITSHINANTHAHNNDESVARPEQHELATHMITSAYVIVIVIANCRRLQNDESEHPVFSQRANHLVLFAFCLLQLP